MVESKIDSEKTHSMKDASRMLKKSICVFDSVVNFGVDIEGLPVDGQKAFEILGRGAEALSSVLDLAEVGKALVRLAKKRSTAK